MNKSQNEVWLIPLAFVIVYVVWGTTYLANAWGVKMVPPFLFASIRFMVAGSILLLISSFFSPIKITRSNLKNLVFAGFLLFGIGNGLVTWALQHVESGITALVIAFEPLLVALLLWQMKREKPKLSTWIGIFLGILGMVLLVGQPQFVSSWNWLVGLLFCLIAITAWGYISIWISSADLPESVFQSAAFQMIFGGIILLITSFFLGDFEKFSFDALDKRTVLSWTYLIVFGSILAFSAFNYLLLRVSPTKVAASAYVHPVIALGLGYWLNREVITIQSLLAAAVLLTGVVFINREKKGN